MRSDLTDITLVVDRSGSMAEIKSDAEGGVNEFIKKQAAEPGKALLTLVQFDTAYEFVHRGVPIDKAPPYVLDPRGMTALLDAVGRAIIDTGKRLEGLPEAERPGLVIFVVMTDGHENSSQEFSASRIKEMIEHQTTKYNWQFTFLGADQESFAEAGQMGFDPGGVAVYSTGKMAATYAATSNKVSRMRMQRQAEEEVCNDWTDDEREEMG